ncbi:MAG: Hpt domain-containing protein [Myxococcales bacterium]|nr:Hpt domain-containing protein [Myxococcales bacterium]
MERSILVVSRNEELALALAPIAAAAGVMLEAASELQLADRLTSERTYALLIVDEQLPDGGGAQWVARLDARASRPPVILVAESLEPIDRVTQWLEVLKIDAVLARPIALTELWARVEELLGLPHVAHIARAAAEGGHDPDDSFDRAFDALRDGVRRRLPRRLERLADAIERLLDQPTPERLDETRLLAHKLGGSAGSTGFSALADAVLRLERSLASVSADAGAVRARGETWSRLLAEAREGLEE